jgi:hypothetical protein
MLMYITDYNWEIPGQDLGPESGRHGRDHVGVYEDCKNFKKMWSAFKYVSF